MYSSACTVHTVITMYMYIHVLGTYMYMWFDMQPEGTVTNHQGISKGNSQFSHTVSLCIITL